jgi:ADP-ribose pyrophosphatase YjhB (NUDIX family)
MRNKQYQAAGGVVVHEGRILLLDRPSRGEIRLPKGHVERDEAADEAALREVAEESGYCDLEILADLGNQVVEFDYSGAHYVRSEHYFLVALRSETQIPRNKKDADQFQVIWVSAEQAEQQLTYAAEQAVLRKAVQAYQRLHEQR